MRKNSNQSGFAILEIIIILIILGLVSFTGWFVWHKHNTNKAHNSSSAASQAKAASSKKSSNAKPAPPPQQYLVIKEWGVKIPLSAQITGAYYTLRSSPPEEFVDLLDTGFDNTSNSNGVSCHGGYTTMYVIARVKTQDIGQVDDNQGEQTALQAGGVSTAMPGYYVSGTKADQSLPECAYLNVTTDTEDQNITTLWAAKKAALNTAYSQLQQQ